MSERGFSFMYWRRYERKGAEYEPLRRYRCKRIFARGFAVNRGLDYRKGILESRQQYARRTAIEIGITRINN